jgi:hypothetical protein
MLLIASALSGIIELWMGFHHMRNLWISHLFTLIEYVLVLFMYSLWKPKKTDKKILLICIGAFMVFWAVSKYTIEPFYRDDTYTAAIGKMIEIIVATWVLFDVLRYSNSVIKTDARVWISSGIIIYAAGSLFLFALFNMLVNTSPELIKTIWPVNWILSILTTLLLARGIWCRETH